MWATIAAALPLLLPPTVGRPPQRLAGLVALGCETAPLAGAGGPIPAITAAAGGGSSHLAAEARRLDHLLTTAPPGG